MTTKTGQIEQWLHVLQAADLPTLMALDRELHRLVRQKGQEVLRTRPGTSALEEFGRQYPHLTVAPALLALVGVHPENPVEEDKILLRESIARRFRSEDPG